MDDICTELRRVYHLEDVDASHPIRRAVDEIRRLRAMLDEMRVLVDALDEARRQSMDARNALDAHKQVASEWHRRMQQAEAACAAAYEGRPRSGGKSVGRSLANMAAMHYRGERDAAVALLRECRDALEWWRNAQHFMPDDQAELLARIDAVIDADIARRADR